jgi:hypothetical protein
VGAVAAPLAKSIEKILNPLFFRPEVAVENIDVLNRSLALLSNQLFETRGCLKVVSGVVVHNPSIPTVFHAEI